MRGALQWRLQNLPFSARHRDEKRNPFWGRFRLQASLLPIMQWARWILHQRIGHTESPAWVLLGKRLACSFAYYTLVWCVRAHSCPILCDPMYCSPQGSSVHALCVLNLGLRTPWKASAPYNCTSREQICRHEVERVWKWLSCRADSDATSTTLVAGWVTHRAETWLVFEGFFFSFFFFKYLN